MRKMNVIPSPIDTRDWILEKMLYVSAYPDELDLRHKLLLPRDQGSQGSCAAMAGAAMKEVHEYDDSKIFQYFSPQFIYNNRENISYEGMYMRDLMKILKEYGTCLENSYPYSSMFAIPTEAYNEASRYKISSYASITTIDGLKQSIFVNGPAIIAVPVYNYTGRMWYKLIGDSFLGGHAMLVVGYTKDGFIIRNSWGENWQDKGYTIFPYEDWGMQWEVWTTIDVKTGPEKKEEIKNQTIWESFRTWLKSILTWFSK